jgi:hypothetical protein
MALTILARLLYLDSLSRGLQGKRKSALGTKYVF